MPRFSASSSMSAASDPSAPLPPQKRSGNPPSLLPETSAASPPSTRTPAPMLAGALPLPVHPSSVTPAPPQTSFAASASDASPAGVDLLRGQKADKVDVTIQPEELEVMDDVLAAKYEEARKEEKLRNQKEDFSDMVAGVEKKRKRKMHDKEGKSKKRDFKF